MSTPYLLRLSSLCFFSTIFVGMCLGTLCIVHSPHLVPSAYYLFANLHWWLERGGGRSMIFVGCRSESGGPYNYFQKLDKNFYVFGIPKLFNHYKKCIACLVDCVENSSSIYMYHGETMLYK